MQAIPAAAELGLYSVPAAGREQMPLSSERFLPRNTGLSAPALRTSALQTAGPGNLYQPALRLRQPSSALQMSSVSPSGALQRGLLQSVREF